MNKIMRFLRKIFKVHSPHETTEKLFVGDKESEE